MKISYVWNLVVTGCTDGIGKAYAKELARKGLSIVLVSRNQEKLDKTAAEISKYLGNLIPFDKHEINNYFHVRYLNYLKFQYYSIGNTFNVETRTLKVDFNDGPPVYENIGEQLSALEIGILGSK